MARTDRLAKDLVELALELHRRRVWRRVPADAPLLVRIPTESEPVVAVLVGADEGEEIGLVVVEGPHAYAKARTAVLPVDVDDFAPCDDLSVLFDRLQNVPLPMRATLQAAGLQARGERTVPVFWASPGYREPRPPTRREMRVLGWCLAAVLGAEESGELQPTPVGEADTILELEVDGRLRSARVAARFVPAPSEELPPVRLADELGRAQPTDQRWVVGLLPLPVELAGPAEALRAMHVLDEESGDLLASRFLAADDPETVARWFGDVVRELGVPLSVVATSREVHGALAPELGPFGVECELDLDHPGWRELAEAMADALPDGMYPMMPEALSDATPEPDPPPLPSELRTLEDWTRAEEVVSIGLVQDAVQAGLHDAGPLTRYFGSEEIAREALQEYQGFGVLQAFAEWFAADYRATPDSPTLLEERLAGGEVRPTVRPLLEARRDATLSWYRVDSSVPGRSFEVEDLLSGERFTVHEERLSRCHLDGYGIPLRLLRFGRWYSAALVGTPASLLHADDLLTRLEVAGARLEPGKLRESAHLFGHLWGRMLEETDERDVTLHNTDGDPLERHTAELHVADPTAFVATLERRDDVIVDDPGAVWTWVRAVGRGIAGEGTVLAHLALFDDALVATVNSARRLEGAREWLESFPGVRFRSSHRDDDEPPPPDDRYPEDMSEPLDPEDEDELARFLLDRALRWVDEAVPLLGDLTPRAACATETGRRRVARLVRSMPLIQTPLGPIQPPRERILRELGLEAPRA